MATQAPPATLAPPSIGMTGGVTGRVIRIRLVVEKFNPEQDPKPHEREYHVDLVEAATVLDALYKIKEEQDGTLTFRASCRSAICGSCAMHVNGQARLACHTRVDDLIHRFGEVRVGPMRLMPVLKDLAVDMGPFWHKVDRITPWLQPTERPVAAPKGLAIFENVDACVMCGACVSACTSLEVSPGFIGPAALAKAYRFHADPRDGRQVERLTTLTQPDGIWDCTRCNFCVEVCPKDVKPMEAITRLRRAAIEARLTERIGARHIMAFTAIVRHEGRLNEALLPFLMLVTNPKALLRAAPLALRMFLKGKMPFPFKRPIRGIPGVRRIFGSRGL